MNMRSRGLAFAATLAFAVGGLAGVASAHEESEGELDALSVEARPSILQVGATLVLTAEYGDDEDESDDRDEDEAREGSREPDSFEPDDEPSGEASEESSEAGEDESDEAGAALVVDFAVDFGDGSAPEAMTVKDHDDDEVEAVARHSFAAAGVYQVTVTATPEAGEPTSVTVKVQVGSGSARVAGGDRLETAIDLSHEDFPADGSANAVLLARSDQYADALAAASVALLEDAPVLLTTTDTLPAAVLDEIDRGLGGTGTVYLLGGERAIAPSVADALTARGYVVVRISGEDRIATALQIAQFLVDAGIEIDEVVLAGSTNFPDALAAASFAAAAEAPVLLTAPGALDPRVEAFLNGLGGDVEVIVAGGVKAVGAEVEARLVALGFEVERHAGRDRFETAVEIADELFPDATVVVVATGTDFADALAGAAHAGRLDAPILLVAGELPQVVADYLARNADAIDTIYTLGGEKAVPDAVLEKIEDLLED